MKNVIIGIGELAVSNTPDEVVRTLGLGSCIGLVIIEPSTRTVGMAHIALPDSRINPALSKNLPGYYADTAIPALLQEISNLSLVLDRSRYIIKLAGGASVMDTNHVFNIGQRNLAAIELGLKKHNLRVTSMDCGKAISRTLEVQVNTGLVVVTSSTRERWQV